MQAITYREFLPALLGNGGTTPKAEAYVYQSQTDASITTAFAHAAFRYGHSTVSSQLQLADDAGATVGSIDVRNAFYNPGILGNNPENVDRLLKGRRCRLRRKWTCRSWMNCGTSCLVLPERADST
jgi:hypothetical protein